MRHDLFAYVVQLSLVIYSLPLAPFLVTAIDLNTMGEMNNSATTFYAGMNERISHLVRAADRVQARADDAKRFSKDIELIFQKARRLEALVDRLDEYTSRQEAALSHNRR